ncbi:uncharacterized protein EAF01_011022 [Botrytis porri]|uniref:uncharacterized protein n=1 Tax=Botrytis porri TaxID=87229 RepID=UPI0018FF8D2D|nr:uncharacterized protein EAF01_011022 [Botrytis porri]KAF7887868.1 hypothetical protein EAF01_011022 [Botrytis porri]
MQAASIATYENQLKFERDAQTRPYTEYARKFGPKSPDRAQGKSWLTPLDPLFPVNWENERQDDRHNIIGAYQKQELLMFTSRELKDLDAICDRPLRESTLSGGILPILQRDKWEDKPSDAWLRTDSIPIRHDPDGGKWQSSNDKVWEVLKPIVTLASQFITSSKSLPWLDALLLGPRAPVNPDRFPPGTKILKEYHTFSSREGPWTVERENEVAAERDRVFSGLMKEMDFMCSYFYSHQNVRDNDPPNNDPTYPVKKFGDSLGVSTINTWEMLIKKKPGAKWRVQMFLNVESLEPIFFQYKDLSDSELAGIRYRCASTIAHELMHAIGYYQSLHRLGIRVFTNNREGYFETEQSAELGWSWQWAIFGGIDLKKPINWRSRRLLCQFAETMYPSFTSKVHGSKSQPILIEPPIETYIDFHPIGVQYLEDVHTQDFWDLMVRGFGGRILKYRAIKEGTRVIYRPDSGANSIPFLYTARDRLDPAVHDPYVNDDAMMTQGILNIQSQMETTPMERQVLKFCAKIAESAKTGKEFWENMESQVKAVGGIIEVLVKNKNKNRGREGQLGLMDTIIKSVVELSVAASTNHERLVEITLQREKKLGGLEDTTSKRALLVWNRGARGFNREVIDKIGKRFRTGELAMQLNQSYNRLEKCQALFFTPSRMGIASKYPTEQREFDMMFDATKAMHNLKDYDKARQLYSQIVSNKYAGSFAKSAASMMTANCEAEKVGGVEKLTIPIRHKCWRLLGKGLERLVWLEPQIVQVSEGWQELFRDYIEWGKVTEVKLRIKQQDVLPPGIEESGESSQTAGNRSGGQPARATPQKRTREDVKDLVDEVMEDVVCPEPEEWESMQRMRAYKKMKRTTRDPGDTPPE